MICIFAWNIREKEWSFLITLFLIWPILNLINHLILYSPLQSTKSYTDYLWQTMPHSLWPIVYEVSERIRKGRRPNYSWDLNNKNCCIKIVKIRYVKALINSWIDLSDKIRWRRNAFDSCFATSNNHFPASSPKNKIRYKCDQNPSESSGI